MPLKLRPTGLGSGIDKDRPDYTVYTGEWDVGRIYRRAAVLRACAVLLDGRQRSDDTLGSRGHLGLRQGKHIHGMEHGPEAAKRQKLCVINR